MISDASPGTALSGLGPVAGFLERRTGGEAKVFVFSGNLEFINPDCWKEAFRLQLQYSETGQFIFDLSQMEYADCSVMGALVSLHCMIRRNKGKLVCIRPAHSFVWNLFHLGKLNLLLDFADNLDQAMNKLAKSPMVKSPTQPLTTHTPAHKPWFCGSLTGQ
mgnify:CR=1 FL=1